ncbi:MAG: pentapeptide repeat-containing protein [Actinomycetes bacterium]
MADIHREGDYRGVDWSGRHLAGHRFERCAFGDADLLELVTEQVVFEECDFSGVRLNASDHVSTAFLHCRFLRTSLFAARLAGCKLVGSVFEGPCVLKPLRVEGGDWSYVSLRGQDLSGLDLTGVRLHGADLSMADLRGTGLRRCDLGYARFDEAVTAGLDLREADVEAVDLRNLDLAGVRLDLAQAVQLVGSYGAIVDV